MAHWERWQNEPVRFVAFCPKGHIQDLPYIKIMSRNVLIDVILNWEHTSQGLLYIFDDGRGHGFNSLRMYCAICKNTTSLKAFQPDDREKELDKFAKLYKCDGCKPWIREDKEECDEILDVTPRSSSRLYMPIQLTDLHT